MAQQPTDEWRGMYPPPQPVEPKPQPVRRSGGARSWVGKGIILVVGLIVGTAIGVVGSVDLSDELDTARDEAGDLRLLLDDARGRADDADQRAVDADQRAVDAEREFEQRLSSEFEQIAEERKELRGLKKELAAREAKITATEHQIERNTITDGIWEVGTDFDAGTYRATGRGSCYWARLSDPSGDFASIITNGGFTKNQTVTLSAGEWFESSGCGEWVPIGG